jgi:5'-nucleotidase
VLYGVLAVASRRPDLVISGINYGENLGTSVTVSGTVGAALQAAEMGIPGLAVSLETEKAYHYDHGEDVDWRAAAHFTHRFAEVVLQRQLPFDVDVLKVEVPRGATPRTAWRATRVSRQPYWLAKASGRRELPEARPLDYETGYDPAVLEPDSDIHALLVERVVSVSPLSLDLTSRVGLGTLEELLR